jgi:2-C-methyl-D-erythritol 2,4-cyclodiphosphate synthase
MLAERGFQVEHVDATIVIERPAVSPQRGAMRQRLAEALGLSAAAVNVKATRGEGMGFVGRQEGIAALAVATISPTT